MRAHNFSRSIARLAFSLVVVGGLAWPVSAAEQAPASQPSLADVARQEAERRKATKDTQKVITTKDMPESARKPVSAPAAAPAGGSHAEGAHAAGASAPGAAAAASGAATAASGSSDQKSTAPGAASSSGSNDESAWRSRMTQARDGLSRNETFLQALQSRLNSLTNDFRNGAGNFPQQAQINTDREKALKDMERVKADVELSRKQIADIEEEARKAGVPPGWLR